MNLLDTLVIPQPDYNLNLLNVLLIIALGIFVVFSATLFGSTILSVYFKRKSKSFNDEASKLALLYSELVTDKNMYAFGLGVIPFLSIIFIYIQLLHKANGDVAIYLLLAFVLYLVGLITAFNYRKAFSLAKIFDNVNKNYSADDSIIKNEINFVSEESNSKFNSLGNVSVIFQFIAYWIFVGSVALASNPAHWEGNNIGKMLIAPDTIIAFLQFITLSLALSGITYLFKNYVWDKKDLNIEELNTPNFKTNMWIAIVSSVFVPVFFGIGLWSLPKSSFNLNIFLVSLSGIILVVLALQWLYVAYKEKNLRLINYAYIAMILVVFAFAFKDKTAFAVANKSNVVVLNEDYLKHKEEFMASLGLQTVEVNGEEIYKGRCAACHKDVDAPTAPAHKNIIQKYLTQADPKAALVKFVMNPVKVNPNYPPMPNQGLTPAEAGAVAEFMIAKYGGKKEVKK